MNAREHLSVSRFLFQIKPVAFLNLSRPMRMSCLGSSYAKKVCMVHMEIQGVAVDHLRSADVHTMIQVHVFPSEMNTRTSVATASS